MLEQAGEGIRGFLIYGKGAVLAAFLANGNIFPERFDYGILAIKNWFFATAQIDNAPLAKPAGLKNAGFSGWLDKFERKRNIISCIIDQIIYLTSIICGMVEYGILFIQGKIPGRIFSLLLAAFTNWILPVFGP